MKPDVVVPVTETSRIGEARRAAARAAADSGLDRGRANDAAIVATELATNLVRHAGGGRLLIHVEPSSIEMVAIDSGPGMADAERCLVDGYSTAGTAGTGLGAVQRLSD